MKPRSQFEIDKNWLLRAIELSKKCSAPRIYCVGCVIVNAEGVELASGYTGEVSYPQPSEKSSPHAEEIALSRIPQNISAPELTLYSNLEPCSERLSGIESCCSRIIAKHLRRVVFGAKEPFDARLKITCRGESTLRSAGFEVLQLEELSDLSLQAAKRADLDYKV